jgi:pimeloyl-ACP methyl ester carboxylesterase
VSGHLTLEEWKAGGRTFQYRGHDIFYRVDGSGDPLLLIHGFPTASFDWSRVWPALTARFRVVTLDMIGFGFSGKPVDYGYSIFDQATIHERVLASVGVAWAHVLAHDYGDTVAQELLARHAERRAGAVAVASVCFLNGGLFPETHRALPTQRLLASPLGALVGRLMNADRFARGFGVVFGPRTKPSPAEMADYWTLVATNQGQRVAHKLIGYMAERRRHRERWVGALQHTTVPLRVVNGPDDPVSGRHMVERYRELVPNPDVVLLEGIGHYPQVEDPEGVLRAYFEFVDRVRR